MPARCQLELLELGTPEHRAMDEHPSVLWELWGQGTLDT